MISNYSRIIETINIITTNNPSRRNPRRPSIGGVSVRRGVSVRGGRVGQIGPHRRDNKNGISFEAEIMIKTIFIILLACIGQYIELMSEEKVFWIERFFGLHNSQVVLC